MVSGEDQNKTVTSTEVLSQKDASLFKNMMDLYNFKNYKKALKIAETLLAKYPTHGETLSVKALLLLFIEPTREDEIIELAKSGLRNGINSYLCWHVLGVIYKHVKKYRETAKCFIMALKLDPHNDRLLREICCLEIELRDYSAFRRFGSTQLKLKSKEYREWCLFAFSQHLCGNLSLSSEILEEADKLFGSDYRVEDYELSESIMYRAMLYEHTGEFAKCAQLLQDKAHLLKDTMSYLEVKAKALYLSRDYERANETYRELMDLNPSNARFVFMLLLTHEDQRVRDLFLLPFDVYSPKRGSIYEEKLRIDSQKLTDQVARLPDDTNYAILVGEEVLDLDGEWSSAGWSLENRPYHTFDLFINEIRNSGDHTCENCYSYSDYSLLNSKRLDLGDLPPPEAFGTFEEGLKTLDSYLSDVPGADLVVYSKYRRFLKRDKYPLCMFARQLTEDEEELLLEALDGLELKDNFIYNSFVFLFSSGLRFYSSAKKFVVRSLDRGCTNIIKSFLHCLTFRKAYILLLLLSEFHKKLTAHQRIDDVKNEQPTKWAHHEVACNLRLLLVSLFLAKLYDFLGSYKRALELLDATFKITPTSVDVLCARGKVLRHMGDYYRSNQDFCMASDIDRSDRQTSAKSAKSILRTMDFEYSLKRWKSFLTEDVCNKNEKEAPPEIPSFKFELMYSRAKLDLYLRSLQYDSEEDHDLDSLKESFEKYRSILDKHTEIYQNQLDFHNYCLNRLAYRVYYNFLKLRSTYCAQGYFIKALKGLIRTSIEMHRRGVETEVDVPNDHNHKNLSLSVHWMKTVLTQRVYDPGLYYLFYKLASICNMNLLFKLQCITRCYYSARCNKLNHHLIKIVHHFLRNMTHYPTFELDLIRRAITLCLDDDLAAKCKEMGPKLASKYLTHVTNRVIDESYDFKHLQSLILCSYNHKRTEFLEKLFENSSALYTGITFKDYLRFKRFLLYAVDSCTNEENREFLRTEMESFDNECTNDFVLSII